MMKKQVFFALFACTLTLACNDFLEVEPVEEVSIDEQFSTLEGTLQALNGLYFQTEALLSGHSFLYADVMGGNIAFAPSIVNRRINIPIAFDGVYSFQATPRESTFNSAYEDAYKAINSANQILQYINNVPDATEEDKTQIRAEVLAARGLLHFTVLQLFAQHYGFSANGAHSGIVYNTRVLQAGVDYPSRLSVAECYKLVVKDFTEASNLFTNQNALPGPGYSYFNEISVKALLAKTYLFAENWQEALNLADEVITNSGISLIPQEDYLSEWAKPTEAMAEALLELTAPFDVEDQVATNTIAQFYRYINPQSYGVYTASSDLQQLYGPQDIRGGQLLLSVNLQGVDANGNTIDREYYFTKKFQDNAGTMVIRLAEMYLIRAEANARLGNAPQALADVNILRGRSGATEITSSDDILETVFLERRLELAFEGHLLFDLARFKKNIVRIDCIASLCNLNYPNNFYILPIPQNSIDINENMQQNEGY